MSFHKVAVVEVAKEKEVLQIVIGLVVVAEKVKDVEKIEEKEV